MSFILQSSFTALSVIMPFVLFYDSVKIDNRQTKRLITGLGLLDFAMGKPGKSVSVRLALSIPQKSMLKATGISTVELKTLLTNSNALLRTVEFCK